MEVGIFVSLLHLFIKVLHFVTYSKMDFRKLVGQHIVKISQSSETGKRVIEFSQHGEIESHQIIEIDPSKLGNWIFICKNFQFNI